MCQFQINSLPILRQFYVKKPLRNLFFKHGFDPTPFLNNVKKKCGIGREGHPSPHYLFPFSRRFNNDYCPELKGKPKFFILQVFFSFDIFCKFEFFLPRPAEGRTKIMELWSCSQVIRGFHAIAIHRIKDSRQQSITTISKKGHLNRRDSLLLLLLFWG